MCGIVGLAGHCDDDTLHRMNLVQRHRGPDDAGAWTHPADRVALAMRRLAILDLAGGHQPMLAPQRGHALVFNGEIFNAPELRRELLDRGQTFATDHSDTEVLLHLYGHDGPAMLPRLGGMFAFVLHDARRRILFGARDRFGIKPLNYAHSGRRFAFASEIKSLLQVPWIGRDLDPQAIRHFLGFQCVPAPRSVFADVRKLPAGHSFELDLETFELKIERWWRPRFGPRLGDDWTPADLPAFVRAELQAAVRRWMLSDVPVAFSLSGGIDSAAVVGLAASAGMGRGLRTYSLGFADAPELDERPLARQVAQRWGTVHEEIVLRQEDLLDDLDPMLLALEEPYAGGLPSWFVFRAMARHVKVALTGTGGDEVFGNYGKWEPFERPRRFLGMLREARRRGSSWSDLLRYPRASLLPLYFRGTGLNALLLPDFTRDLEPPEALVERLWRDGTADGPRDAVAAVDLAVQLPEEFLHMTDRFSMAMGLEARTPFLDHQFVEALYRVPGFLRTRPGRWKHLLIEAVRDLLPPELLTQKKRGFVLPMARWLRTRLRPLCERLLGPDHLRRQGIFRPDAVATLVRPHLEECADRTWQVWTLLFFQLWHQRWIDAAAVDTDRAAA